MTIKEFVQKNWLQYAAVTAVLVLIFFLNSAWEKQKGNEIKNWMTSYAEEMQAINPGFVVPKISDVYERYNAK